MELFWPGAVVLLFGSPVVPYVFLSAGLSQNPFWVGKKFRGEKKFSQVLFPKKKKIPPFSISVGSAKIRLFGHKISARYLVVR
jgi:hypothetical protein